MEHIKTHAINSIYCRPGDTINLVYTYQEEVDGPFYKQTLVLDTFTEPEIIDTVIVYKINSEFGLKTGRAIMMGEANTL